MSGASTPKPFAAAAFAGAAGGNGTISPGMPKKRLTACGPYMEDACHKLALEVNQREISKEAMLKELRIEMETQRRLKKVYEQRKELEIQVEDAPTGD